MFCNLPGLAALGALSASAFAAAAAPATAQENGMFRYGDVTQNAYAVVARIRAKPGMEDALRSATLPLIAQVRAEPNNLLYFLHEDRDAPGHFIFYEIFAGKVDFEAHNRSAHVQAWFSRLPELADGEVTVTHMKLLGDDNSTPR